MCTPNGMHNKSKLNDTQKQYQIMLLKIKDLQAFYGVCEKSAVKYKHVILDSLKKNKNHVTIIDLAQYEGIDVETCKKMLKSARN